MAGNPFVLDFGVPQNALAQWQQGRQFQQQQGLAREQMDWHRDNALAQRDFELQKLAQQDEQFRFTRQQHADDMRSKAPLLAAQAALARSHAGYYDAARAKFNAPPDVQPGGDGMDRLGMREDGTIYEIPVRGAPSGGPAGVPPPDPGRFALSRVLGSSESAPGSVTKENDFGRSGTRATDVPGLVVNDKGAPSQYGTRFAQGQSAVADYNDADRARFMQHYRTQQRFHMLHGKPPSGFVYNDDGSLRDLKDESKKALGRDKIAALMDDVQVASQVFKDTTYLGRAAAGVSGGWINPQTEQASRSVEHAVQFLTAEIEGKRHANAQDVRMLRFFAPNLATDSGEMIQFKLDQLNRIMSNYFGAKTPSGSLFRSELAKANTAYHQAIKAGTIKPPEFTHKPAPMEGAGGTGPQAPAAADRLKSKYGLE